MIRFRQLIGGVVSEATMQGSRRGFVVQVPETQNSDDAAAAPEPGPSIVQVMSMHDMPTLVVVVVVYKLQSSSGTHIVGGRHST